MIPTTQDLLEKSFTLYKNNKVTLLKYACLFALALLATFCLKILISFYLFKSLPTGEITFNTLGTLPSYGQMAIAAAILFVGYLFSLWTTLTMIQVIAKIYTKEALQSVRQEFKVTVKFIFPAVLAIILMALSIIGGLTLLIIPGIVFSIWFVFSVYAVLLDKKKGTKALEFSKTLVEGQWWEVLWLLGSTTFLIFSSSVLFKFILRFIFTIFGQLSGESSSILFGLDILGILLVTLFGLFIAPLSAAVPTILYLELKKNKKL